MDTAANRKAIRFDEWKLLDAPLELFFEDTRVRIQEQPLMVLESLLQQPGSLVNREELSAKLWPRAVTDFDAGLHTAVRKLRAVLKDDAEAPRYIETVPRRGYRFIGRVSSQTVEPPAPVGASARRRRLGWAIAAGVIVIVGAGGWSLQAARSASASRQAAHELWVTGVISWQNVGGGGTTPAEIDRVEDIYTRAIERDPSLAQAHADRGRVRLSKFVSGHDLSPGNVTAARADLARARELAGPTAFVLVREAQMAYLVDGDIERGLALLDEAEAAGPLDGDQLMTRANFLASAGRPDEAWPIYEKAVRLDPGNPAIYRFWMSNLFSAHRPIEAMRVLRQFDARIPGRLERGELLFSYTGDPRRWRVEVEAANRSGRPANGLSNEFDLLRMEGRLADLQKLVAGPEPAQFRPHSASRSIVGIPARPVAELRGWERLLGGDRPGAAAAGDELRRFLARQTAGSWNAWSLPLLQAEASVMAGEHERARAEVAQALLSLPKNRSFPSHLYPRMMAARVLAWSGDPGAALALIESLSADFPGLGPAAISREPLFSVPLSGNSRWQALRARLEAQILAPEALGS